MDKFKAVCFLAVVLSFVALPGFAQEADAGNGEVDWGILAAGFAIGVAAFGGALGQAKATAAGLTGMARNPGASGNIRTTLIIGLALIESLVIYALLIALRGAGFF